MPLTKFLDGQAFVVTDAANTPASGPVRIAPKVLQSTSKDLARTMTYRFALFGIQRIGLAAGVNIDGGEPTLEAMLAEVASQDPSPDWHIFQSTTDAASEAAGVVAAASAARDGGLDGARVIIDRLDAATPELLGALESAGAQLVAIGTTAGTLTGSPLSFDDMKSLGPAPDADTVLSVGHLEEVPALASSGDVLLTGAKMGAIDHTNAGSLSAKVVAPIGFLPFTTKAAVMMQRSQIVALPDFLTLAGGSLVSDGTAGDAATAAGQIAEMTRAVIADAQQLPSVAAALRAEEFLATWQRPLFGRPFAP